MGCHLGLHFWPPAPLPPPPHHGNRKAERGNQKWGGAWATQEVWSHLWVVTHKRQASGQGKEEEKGRENSWERGGVEDRKGLVG